MAEIQTLFDPDQHQPFYAYRRLQGEHAHLQDLAPSLSHFYEAEKLRGRDEDLRQQVLDCPTPRAARKLTLRHKQAWRPDWNAVRASVLRAGMAMQMVQSADTRQRMRAAYEQQIELAASTKRIGGVPAPFLADNIARVMEQKRARNSIRLGLLILQGYEPVDLEQRLDALFARQAPFSAAVYIGKEASTRAEAWCMDKAIPLRYIGDPSRRLRPEDHAEIGERISTLILCGPQTRKAVSLIVQPARRARTTVIDLTPKQIQQLK